MTTTWPEAQSPGELLSFSLAPNAVRVQYQARTPGILTLTDSYAGRDGVPPSTGEKCRCRGWMEYSGGFA